MAFTGDLEHLPITDVIQLLHLTGKTGTLSLESGKGKSQLVFNDGYFVSANHLNNSVRIGQILVGMNTITQGQLDQALREQKNAGSERKPLIATLLEQGTINREEAYRGLETLIEMTIVEVLTWTSGTFSLDVTRIDVSDEYRYFPETLKQEIYLNAQSILMDALRIYDEKMRDGTLADLFFSSSDVSSQGPPADGGGAQTITAGMLGLDAIDTLEKRIPDVFTGIKDHAHADSHPYLNTSLAGTEQHLLNLFVRCFRELDTLDEAPALVLVLLRFAAAMFERAITLVVGRNELIAERGIGVKADKSAGPSPPLLNKIPLDRPSPFRDAVESGLLYYGQGDDPVLRDHLFEVIGAPGDARILLAPIKSFGKVIAVVYADFGPKAGYAARVELIDILARHAGQVLDNALYRKRFTKTT